MNSRQETLTEQDTPRTPAPGVGWEEFSRELVEFFASIKLAMFLFLFIAIPATIGTVIQQGERPETYIQDTERKPTAGFCVWASLTSTTPGGSPVFSGSYSSIRSRVSTSGFRPSGGG